MVSICSLALQFMLFNDGGDNAPVQGYFHCKMAWVQSLGVKPPHLVSRAVCRDHHNQLGPTSADQASTLSSRICGRAEISIS
jgi:hypothetical protein